jgi:hypothetical protein
MGEALRLKMAISQPLSRPRVPNNEVKAVATTIVGNTKGMVVSARSSVLPRNSYRAKTKAAGRPSSKVSSVETVACQTVNHSTRA